LHQLITGHDKIFCVEFKHFHFIGRERAYPEPVIRYRWERGGDGRGGVPQSGPRGQHRHAQHARGDAPSLHAHTEVLSQQQHATTALLLAHHPSPPQLQVSRSDSEGVLLIGFPPKKENFQN
jgi:hypothetical protein